MKIYNYNLPISIILKGYIFFGFCFLFGFYLNSRICGGYDCSIALLISGKGQFLSREMTFICFIFLLLGFHRFMVRFQKKNNKIILTKNEIIVPGALQVFPEKTIDLSRVEKVEKEIVGNNSNIVIKIYFKDETKPFKIFWSNFMSMEKFNELYSDLSESLKNS